jgi:hypothetical protein
MESISYKVFLLFIENYIIHLMALASDAHIKSISKVFQHSYAYRVESIRLLDGDPPSVL